MSKQTPQARPQRAPEKPTRRGPTGKEQAVQNMVLDDPQKAAEILRAILKKSK